MKQKILEYLKEAFGMDEADALDLFASYIEALTENIEKFDSLMEANDYGELTRAAHTVKGCATNSGHTEMATVAREMELAAKAHNKEAAAKGAIEVKAIYEKLKQE